VALLLKRHGITHVRPLEGGFDAWVEAGYPVGQLDQTPVVTITTSTTTITSR
jgi:3-mercaptopyruvate sulfurtransferase SseA